MRTACQTSGGLRHHGGVLWVVAGCLFEVSFPAEGEPWRWAGHEEAMVTLLAEDRRGGDDHFRFRAEAPGEVELTFVRDFDTPVTVTVHIAPEHLA